MSCFDNSPEAKESRKIEKKLSELENEERKEIKILLLGTGGCGKTTIFKQMKIINANGFQKEEQRTSYTNFIKRNVFDIFSTLIEATKNITKEDINTDFKDTIKIIEDERDIVSTGFTQLTPNVAKELSKLWLDQAIQNAYKNHKEALQIIDSAEYIISRVEDIAKKDYVPTVDDILRCRNKTTGIITEKFNFGKKMIVNFVDVGGQRTERKKWIHAFDQVLTVMFVASLSEYNQLCEEDNKTNRMIESLQLFEKYMNNYGFAEKPIIMFMNKYDLFEKKIQEVDLKVCFDDYNDGKNKDKAYKFIEKKFQTANKKRNRQLIIHQTTATDTNIMKNIFNTLQGILLEIILNNGGVM